jgi:hypothetical protein
MPIRLSHLVVSLAAVSVATLGLHLPPGPTPEVRHLQATSRPQGTDAVAFTVRSADGSPGRWRPCRAIRIAINPSGAPAGSLVAFHQALTKVSRWTGLRFTVGATRLRPGPRYGTVRQAKTWPPVLLAFARPGSRWLSDPSASAVSAPVWIRRSDGRAQFVSGSIVVNTAQRQLYGDGHDGRPSRVRLFEHELGHVVGLDHVHDPRSLMFPTIRRVRGMSPGDRSGFRRLGGPCAASPDAR